jgi:GNAT superfamily N-acetyltransferase
MGHVVSDLGSWVEAGGDARRHGALAKAAPGVKLQVFTDRDARALAAVHPDRPDVGTIGDWVGGVEVLRAAEQWLAEQGASAAEGPALLAPWFPYRANLGPYDHAPLSLEPTEKGARWVEAGYEPVGDYVSILSAHDPQIKAATERAGALGSRGWRIDPLETGPSSSVTPEAYDAAVKMVHDVASRAYADVPGYLPVSPEAVAEFYGPWVPQLDPRLSLVARDPAGHVAGFVLGVPDAAQPARKWFQVMAMAVVPEHRGSGVATWMVGAVHRAASRAGYVAGIHALVHVDPGVQDRTWFRGDVIRRYALYRKAW